jgi:hypothetical protein
MVAPRLHSTRKRFSILETKNHEIRTILLMLFLLVSILLVLCFGPAVTFRRSPEMSAPPATSVELDDNDLALWMAVDKILDKDTIAASIESSTTEDAVAFPTATVLSQDPTPSLPPSLPQRRTIAHALWLNGIERNTARFPPLLRARRLIIPRNERISQSSLQHSFRWRSSCSVWLMLLQL